MFQSRALASLLVTVSLLGAAQAHAGIQPIPDQDIPSGKTLVVPIPATDPGGPARSYTVTVGPATTSGSPTTTAGINATIRTGDPHFILGVRYTDSSNAIATGTMEFQLLREFSPRATGIIGGLTQGGFYSPVTNGANPTKYITFHRVVPGFVIQGGDPEGNGLGGPGFTFESEYSNALIFSGTSGQLAMANSNTHPGSTTNPQPNEVGNGNSNKSQFFITLSSDRQDLDYGYTIFGQMLRGYDTLTGIAGTMLEDDGSGNITKPVHPVDITSASLVHNNTDAVLLLSATGVCDAVITVTASPGGSPPVHFTAHSVADSFGDPPFPQPPPDITSTNGSVNVPIQATDLQLDLIRYGYQTFLPVNSGGIASGTSPVVSIPLISNTANSVSADVSNWAGSSRGFAGFPFTIGAGSKPLAGSLTPVPAGTFGALNLLPYPVVVFTSSNAADTAASFTGSVNWGDGALLSGSNISFVTDGAAHRFKLVAGHHYTKAGEFPLIVNIADPGGAHLNLTGTANIAPSAIGISGSDIYNTGGALQNQVLATFKDVGASSTPSDYTATINWGDGSLSAGTVASGFNSSYQVVGSHVYRGSAAYTLFTAVTRTGAGYAGSTWTTAHVSGVAGAPQVFPPFPQAHLVQVWSGISAITTDSNSIVTTGSLGGNPLAGLITGTDGLLYGATRGGGSDGDGTVFRMPTSGPPTTLYTFTGGNDGSNPYAALVQGTNGFFYGTAEAGGANGFGTIYQLTASGSFTTLYAFAGGADGGNPFAPLVRGTNGFFYGTTESAGGTGGGGAGTIFRIQPGSAVDTLHAFTSGTDDGGAPVSPLVEGTNGNFYGTTSQGGKSDSGTVYQMTPAGVYTNLYSFTTNNSNAVPSPNGAAPAGALVEGTNGEFYGTTFKGGASSVGTIFSITASGSLTTLYSFTGNDDGANPYSGLVTGTDGNFYGTAVSGGGSGDGTVFKITPGGSLEALYGFTGGADGRNPYGPLLLGPDGNFYGTTEIGGANGYGTVFRITPAGALTTLASFGSGESFQEAIRAAVAIVNSGNKPSLPGSLSVYLDPNGTLDSDAIPFTSRGESSFPIPAILPGKYSILTFYLEGSVIDTRLKLPVGVVPAGQSIIGVVTYSDPVGDFDGSQKIIDLGEFPQ